MTTTSEWPHRFCLTADALCVLPPYPGYYPTRGPRCCLLPEAKKFDELPFSVYKKYLLYKILS